MSILTVLNPFVSDTSCWSSLTLPQLNSIPRAGHSIITMPFTCTKVLHIKIIHRMDKSVKSTMINACLISKDSMDEEEELSDPASQMLLVFGGGDNEGSFFSDLITMPVKELRQE